MATQPHRIVIVEDDEHTRARLGDTIAKAPGFVLVGDWGSLTDARANWQAAQADILLVDLDLPDGSGVDLIREVSALAPALRIMVISVFGDERHVIDAVEAGASGYLLKDSDDNQITEAMEQLLAGGSPITASVAVYLLKRFRPVTPDDPIPADEVLTDREREVLQLIAKGLTYTEVGSVLEISINTVRVHIKKIFRKLHVNSRGEAVFEAVDRGILDLGK